MLAPSKLTRLANLLGGLPILGCRPGSAADRAGIRYGDVVLSMNSIPTRSWFEFFQLRGRIRGPIWVRVFRRGRQFVLPLELNPRAQSPRELLGDLQEDDARSSAEQLEALASADSYS